MLRVTNFAAIEQEFIQRAYAAVWCNMATVDSRGRPRSRVVHPLWEGSTGWITTRASSVKVKQINASPHVSLAYIADPFRAVYVECEVVWVGDIAAKQHVWALCRSLPEPSGFDPAPIWGDIADPSHGLLRLTPWRIEMDSFGPNPTVTIWQADH